MSAPIIIKAQRHDDLRRWQLAGPSAASFEDIKRNVAELFAMEPAQVFLRYKDDEGDMVTLMSDADLTEALCLLDIIPGKRILRIDVSDLPAPAPGIMHNFAENA